MPSAWHDTLETRLAALFPSDAGRDAARAVLAPLLAGPESARVAVACLKLAGGDLTQLQKCADAAREDYRDILAWAESPRQMRQGPTVPAAEQALARRADAEEYERWLGHGRPDPDG